ncbi:MAG: tetratricopeptide repeat protein [Dongiaceae bacterium]
MKNISEPVRAYRCEPATPAASDAGQGDKPARALPDRPSIAVLPFANMSGDPEQEYFSDGMTEDLITDLSKVSGLFVIARNSSFAYKGKAVKVQDIGGELGVRFVLEGSVRKAGDRVRITAQLVDAANGGHIWADRFDRDLTDIFATQDEVVRKIVDVLAVKLTQGDEQRLRRRGTNNLEAYDIWVRTRGLLGRGTREDIAQARAMHRRAIAIDPNFAAPHAGLAIAAMTDYVNGWTADPAQALDEAERWARRAVELNEQDPAGHLALGGTLMWRHEHDAALAEHRRSIELDPNYAQGYAGVSMTLVYAGRASEALEPLATAMRLDPHHSNFLLHVSALAHFGIGRYETAVDALLKRIALNPNTDASRMLLAACYGHLGRVDEARAAWAELLRVNPGFSLAQRARVLPFRDAADFQRITDGLAKAGLG